MATDPVAREMIRRLEIQVNAHTAQIASVKGVNDQQATQIGNLQNETAALDGRVDKLEAAPPDPQPPVPPVADCTVTQLPTPPLTVRIEALDQGPEATYAWKLGKDDTGDGEDTATGRVLEAVTYPHAGPRVVTLTVMNENGEDIHTHSFDVLEPAVELPPDGGGGGETTPPPSDGQYGDLYSLRPANLVDDNDLRSRLNTLYDGDAVIGKNLNRVTENGLQRLRHTFDRRGLSCANDVSCQCGSKRIAPRQEIWDRFRFATSPNWLAYDKVQCPQQGDDVGDMKLKFIDTVGGYSGRSGGLLSHNNAAKDAPQGSLYMEESFPPKAPGVPSKGEWIGVTFQPGVVYEIRQHWKYSTGPTSNDGINEVWIGTIGTDGSFTQVKHWRQDGFSTRGDTQDVPERTDGNSWCHNQSSGRHDQPMYIDVFDVDIYSTKPSTWAA